MERARIIPILTIDQRKLVKTVKFKKPNYIGDPVNAIKIFNDKMVDEIVVLDITASAQGREPNYDLIYEMASECFSPLGYGGGITKFEQAQRLFSLGVEKVILNTCLKTNPGLIQQIADTYGSQSVVVSLDVKKKLFGGKKPHFKSATESVSTSVTAFAQEMEAAGAGEIVLNNVDADGTFDGYDKVLINEVAKQVAIPVVAAGGASSFEEMFSIIEETDVSAAAGGSVFVYKGNNTNSILISYPTPEDIKAT